MTNPLLDLRAYADSLYTYPAQVLLGTAGQYPLAVDISNQLVAGETPASPVTVLTDTTAAQAVTLPDAPTISGTIITQIVRGSSLTAGHNYRLTITYTASTGKQPECAVTIVCPF